MGVAYVILCNSHFITKKKLLKFMTKYIYIVHSLIFISLIYFVVFYNGKNGRIYIITLCILGIINWIWFKQKSKPE